MENAIISMLTQVVGELILAALGIAATWFMTKMAQNSKLENISRATAEAVCVARQTVMELQQTVVDGLKAAHEDGKLTESEIESLKRQLQYKAVNKLSNTSIKILEAAGIDLSGIIQGAAEELIANMH